MKKITLVLLLLSSFLSAQVGINTTSPSGASVLHLNSKNSSGTYGGFMPPVVTLTERSMIPVTNSDEGMMVFLSEGTTRCLQVYNASSSTWVDMYCMPVISASITYYQDFEVVPSAPELPFSGGSGSVSTGSGSYPSSPMFSEGVQGYGVNDSNSSIYFNSVDSSGHSAISLSFDLASFSGSSGNGADGADKVEVLVSTDNSTWSSELSVKGKSNAKWGFSGTGIASGVYDGDNNATVYEPVSGGNLSGMNAYSKVVLSNLPVSPTLYIQIRMQNNSGNETWCIDNLILNLM